MKKTLMFLAFVFFSIIGAEDANAAIISDGTYKIQSALNSNKVLDVRGGSTKNGTAVQLYDFANVKAQKWQVKHISGDYYSITTVLDTSKAIDVKGQGKKNGTPVQMYSSNGTNAQKWLIKYAGNGYYYIISKCNGLYLDITGGSSKSGTKVQMYKGNGTNAQKFKFIEILEGKKTIEDGTYTIANALNSNRVLDISGASNNNGANIQNYSKNETWAQIWNVKYLNNGYYSITSFLDESKSLDVSGGGSCNGTNIQLYSSNGTNAQRWIIKDAGNGQYNIVSKLDNMYLDVANGSTKNGANIQLYHSNSSTAQKFIFNKIDASKLKDGLYTINNIQDENNLVSIDKDTATNRTNVKLNTSNGDNCQKWYVKHLGKGYYSLTSSLNPSKAIGVTESSMNNGANVQLYTYNNSIGQKWYIKYAGNGAYYLITQNGNLYFDVAGDNAINDANIQISSETKKDSQKFVFKETTLNSNTKSIEDGYYFINSSLDENKSLDVQSGRKNNGTNVQIYTSNKSVAQTWYFKYLNNGYYSITSSMNPKLSLEVKDSGMANGTNVQINKYTVADNQQWIVKDNGSGYVSIISKQNGLYLDISGGKAVNNANVYMFNFNFSGSQSFKLVKNTATKVYTGIDISYYQEKDKPKVNWTKIANSNLGFVIIRAGYGGDWTSQDDASFKSYVAACEKYNIPYGLYLYSYAQDIENTNKTGAKDEANHMLRLIREIGANNYSPNLGTKVFLDVEDKSIASTSKNQLTSVADYFCSTIEENGYSCGIYANVTWFKNHLNPSSLYPKYDIWIANYFNKTNPTFSDAMSRTPNYNLTPYKYWQFASDGTIDGITGNVDLNLGYDIFD